MKFKILFLLFLGMVNVHSQTVKKSVPAKKPVTTVKATAKTPVKPTVKTPATIEGIFATIATNKGDIVLELEYKKAPVTVANFIALAEGKNTFVTQENLKEKPFFDGLKFHRVIKDFMIQSGDPSNQGTGSASIFGGKSFDTEISNQLYNIRGALALANTGQASSSSSQFFIVQNSQDMTSQIQDKTKYPQKIIDAYKKGGYPSLDGSYTVFGQVISGMDVVDKIAKAEVTSSGSGEASSPVDPVKIKSVKILKNWKF